MEKKIMKKKIMKKKRVCSLWVLLAAVLCLLGSAPALIQVSAQEQAVEERNQIMTAQEKVEAKAEPEEQAAIVHSYESGDSVFVTGETADGWYQITYQDVVGYVPVSTLTEMEIDVEGLDEEFSTEEEEGKLVVEVVERKRAEAKRARIWGTIIVVLVVGIFALGIFSAIKANRSEELTESNPDQMGETEKLGREEKTEPEAESINMPDMKEEPLSEVIDLDQE